MTNQEAIEFLKNMIDREAIGFVCPEREGDVAIWQYHVEALQMAISALQAQDVPDTNVGDMVSRQEAKLKVARVIWEDGDSCYDFHDKCVDCLDDVPSAQPEPCEDAVSLEAAIDVAENAFVRGLLASPDIRRLPSAQPEPQWIPVSERLPDMPIRVLVQLDNGWIITAYRQDNEWFSVPDFGEAIKDNWVEAWMPMPEPYRVERRTDERSD